MDRLTEMTHDHDMPARGCADCQGEARARVLAEHRKPSAEFVKDTVAEIRAKLRGDA